MGTSSLYETQREHLDKNYPFIEQGSEPPGRSVPDASGSGAGTWKGQFGWRTCHGEAVVLWSLGRPSQAFFARYPDGSRGDVTHTLDYGFRRRGTGKVRWVYGTLAVLAQDVLFADGEQPTYTPPARSEIPNLEADLARDEAFLLALKDYRFASAVTTVFGNRDFYSGLDERRWSCGQRQAAHLVAGLRGVGESYHDYFPHDGLDGVWPDDLPEREAFLRRSVETASATSGPPQLEIKVPSTINGERIMTEAQAAALHERWRLEFERNRPMLEEAQGKMLQSAQRQLDELRRAPNSDVYASLHEHLTRLGWRTATAADRKRADARAIQRRLSALREVRELELRPSSLPGAWTEAIRQRRVGSMAIQADALAFLSADEQEVVTGGAARRLRDLALTGRASEEEYRALSDRLAV